MTTDTLDLAADGPGDDVRRERGHAPGLVPSGDAPVRGGRVLEALEAPVRKLEAALGSIVPEQWNPLTRTGAVSMVMLLVAVVTGVALLPFYAASPVNAHASVEAMMAAPFTLGLLRSLHRYSSDAAILFALLHLGRLLLARRIGGVRALGWATGAFMLAGVVVVGWLGYWLVWDDAGALVAIETARALDALRIFGEPIERSFLTDTNLSATLFFVVFFAHMLIPLALGVLLWLHVLKLQRVRLLPSRALTLASLAVLVALCLAVPAPLGPAARMDVLPQSVRLDAWYVAPLALVRQVGSLPALGLVAGATLLLAALPWLLPRRRERRAAEVHASSCNACSQCVQDCPYGAVQLVPRGALPGREQLVAQVDPSRCVGCGLCSASCEPGGIGLPWTTSIEERSLVDAWVSADVAAGSPPLVAWICEEIASPSLDLNPRTGRCDVTGVRSLVVPCAGFIHSLTLERALRKGARGILILSCPEGACRYREGATWLRERLAGTREPALRLDKVDAALIRVSQHGVVDERVLAREVEAFDRGPSVREPGVGRTRLRRALVAAALVAVTCVPLAALSDVRLPLAQAGHGELVVSFRHPGVIAESCRDLSPEEIAALPPHMRRTRECERRRVPVRLRIRVDGAVVHESSHRGAGLWSDGESVAVVTLRPEAGAHRVSVEIGEGAEADTFGLAEEREVTFGAGTRRVVLFDRTGGFTWH